MKRHPPDEIAVSLYGVFAPFPCDRKGSEVFGRSPLILGLFLTVVSAVSAAEPTSGADSQGIEFFEKEIRPILAAHCYECHGPKKQQAGLRLDRRDRMLEGGESGAILVAGHPEESLLIDAVGYLDELLQMPPEGKLADEQIAALVAWVRRGAPGPKDLESAPTENAPSEQIDWAQRLDHWAYQPVSEPLLPDVSETTWPTSPIDRFILAKLEAAGLSPAPPAEKRTLIRRVSFDLTGLPPTPEEVEAFVADASPEALKRVVDRLLQSPHYGERWARHWLDLVRFSETLGHEFDYEIPGAWRYRDYVIRAFNADVPYNQFVVEHIAGDLLAEPRLHPSEGFNESIVGTGFFWFGEAKHSPVDVRQEQVDGIDNRIDVFGKTFLAQTIACARCHDHKFDAITSRDYYALVGFLKSSRYQQAFLDPPERIRQKANQLADLKAEFRSVLSDWLLPVWIEQASRFDRYLLAARRVLSAKLETPSLEDTANAFGVEASRLQKWADALGKEAVGSPGHPLHAWVKLSGGRDEQAAGDFQALRKSLEEKLEGQGATSEAGTSKVVVFEAFDGPGFTNWYVTGDAFGDGPSRAGDFLRGESAAGPIRRLVGAGAAHSGLVSNRLEGVLRSQTFTIEHDFIRFLVAGRGTRINLVIDGFTLIRNPIYGGLTLRLNDEGPAWRTMDVRMWQGHRAYIELIDSTTPNLASPSPPKSPPGQPGDAYLAVEEICFSNDRESLVQNLDFPERVNVDSVGDLADWYRDRFVQSISHCFDVVDDAGVEAPRDLVQFVNWLLENDLLRTPVVKEGERNANTERLAKLLEQYDAVQRTIPAPTRAPALADGPGEDEFVFVRGNYRILGQRAPRRLLEVIADSDPFPSEQGSGRLELARRLVDPANPLTARVMVNRLWKHHFGTGLVATPDDFGRMGQVPTHPELLDYLAGELVRSGWSVKHMHRLMMLSSTYRMSSRSNPQADEADPNNARLHRMPVRRLEGEAIRDAILAVSGRLDRRIFGLGVVPHLTEFMEGRGRPKQSGPLDGAGRRSIYINVRRNFLTPMLLAFDYPIPFTAIGQRNISNVPAQALIMLNSPFVVGQARHWAERLCAQEGQSAVERIEQIYLEAFARQPTPQERNQSLAFLQSLLGDVASETGGASVSAIATREEQHDAWAELCHVILNTKQFIFIR